MSGEQIVFYLLAITTGISAICVILPPFGRNPLHSALALLIAFCALGGLFIMLSAHLVGILQILVYAGAVMVLFVFVIMLLSLKREDLKGSRVTPWKVFGLAAGIAFAAKMVIVINSALKGDGRDIVEHRTFGNINEVGSELVTTYLFPFEVTSLLLLVSIIGAVAIARGRRELEETR